MTEQGKHTAGPWAATTRQGSWDWVVFSEADPNIEICQMFHDGTELNETGEANARLIAAAPDMLEALQAIADSPPQNFDGGTCRAIARAALSKAGGPAMRKRERRATEQKLADHVEFMRQFIREGMDRVAASTKAFMMVKAGRRPKATGQS